MKKVIQTLVDIDKLKGFKIHQLNKDYLKCLEIPRDLIKFIEVESQTQNKSSLYFLISERDGGNNGLYVGQTDNLFQRINEHNKTFNNEEKKRDFTKIIAFLDENNNLSRTYIDYLEWHYISELRKSNSWVRMNDQLREKKPIINEFEEPLLLDLISCIDILLFHNGITFETKQKNKSKEIFSCNKAKAIFENGRLTILSDSILPNVKEKKDKVNRDNTFYEEQIRGFESMIKQLQEWEEEGIVENINGENGEYRVLIDIKLWSPSKAANYAKGLYATSGWTDWKNENGKTLDDVYRK